MMKTLTFIIILLTELFYAMGLISSYMDSNWEWITFLPAAGICGLTTLFVWIYCRMRKVPDQKAVMKSGTVLLYGLEVGAVLACYMVEHWRWLI